MLKQYLEKFEDAAIDVISVFGPWLGPIPSAYLVYRATVSHLGWIWPVALAAAIAVESIGVVSVVLALRLYEWNDTKRKSDPAAPFALSVALVVVYFIVTIGLTVVLDVYPELSRFAPAIFPLLAAVGAVNIAIKNGQQRREATRATEKSNQKRQPKKAMAQPRATPTQSKPLEVDNLTDAQRRVYDVYQRNPNATQNQVADELGITRQAVSKQVRSMNGILSK